MTLWSRKIFQMFSKFRPWLMNFILMNCVLGGSEGMRDKSLLNAKAIIILSLYQSEWRKLLRSASSTIGFSLDTGIEGHVEAHVNRYFWQSANGHPRTYSVSVFSWIDHYDAHHDIDAFCEPLVSKRGWYCWNELMICYLVGRLGH